jgi:hypothetical protein
MVIHIEISLRMILKRIDLCRRLTSGALPAIRQAARQKEFQNDISCFAYRIIEYYRSGIMSDPARERQYLGL